MTETRTMILLNDLGHVEIAWTSESDEAMRAVIEKKMAEGVKFFIMKPILPSILGDRLHRQKRLKTMDELVQQRITVKDKDVEDLFATGKVSLYRRDSGGTVETGARVTSAAEAARSSVVGVRQFQGG